VILRHDQPGPFASTAHGNHAWSLMAQFPFERFWRCTVCNALIMWSAALGERTPPARGLRR
jgi:hypothetical protein